jgi:UDP-N-acetylglucosamine acyltransferase
MNLRLEDAIEQMEALVGDSQQLFDMISFLRNVRRGILR